MKIHFPFFFKKISEIGVIVSTIVIIAIFSFFSERFLTLTNIAGILTIAAELGVATIGASFLMISGEFDLSIGSVFAVTAMSLAFLMKNGFNQFIAFIISLGIACIIGLCNGLITLKARIPSFITTLGMMMFIRGILLAVTGGFPIPCKEQTILLDILAGRLVEDFRTSGIWFLLLTLLFAFMLNSTKYGNWVFATGGNKYVAKALGVDIEKVKLINFMLCSLLAGLAGSISLGRFRMVEPLSGSGMELETIAAAVIGGCSLTGGYGSIIGASIGALLVGMIRVGLVLAGAPAYWYQGFIGIILVIAAIINMQVVRK